jgi:hypothetical protein
MTMTRLNHTAHSNDTSAPEYRHRQLQLVAGIQNREGLPMTMGQREERDKRETIIRQPVSVRTI